MMEDAYVIGIRLALENGVSVGLAVIRQDLATVDQAIAATTAGLARLRQLAEATTSAAAADLQRLSRPVEPRRRLAEPASPPSTTGLDPQRPDPRPVQSAAPSTTIVQVLPAAPPAAGREAGRDRDERRTLASPPTPPGQYSPIPPVAPGPAAAPQAPAAPVIRIAPQSPQAAPVAPTLDKPQAKGTPFSDLPRPIAPARATDGPAAPYPVRAPAARALAGFAPAIARPPPRPSETQRAPSVAAVRIDPTAAGKSVPAAQAAPSAGPPAAPRLHTQIEHHRRIAGKEERGGERQARANPASPPTHAAFAPNLAAPAAFAGPQRAAPSSPAAFAPQAASQFPAAAPPPASAHAAGPSQGDVILDGTRVGRWFSDRLAKEAGRAPAGSTAYDPRMGIAWPGALQGN